MRHYLCLLIYHMMVTITNNWPEICMEKKLRGQLEEKEKYIYLYFKYISMYV